MVCGMELRHFLEKLEVSGSFFASLCFKAERKCQMKGSAASDVYKRQGCFLIFRKNGKCFWQ